MDSNIKTRPLYTLTSIFLRRDIIVNIYTAHQYIYQCIRCSDFIQHLCRRIDTIAGINSETRLARSMQISSTAAAPAHYYYCVRLRPTKPECSLRVTNLQTRIP